MLALRRARRNPRLFLSELAAVVRDRPVAISRATLGEDMLISGLVMGDSAMRALQQRFERGFFRVADVLVARQGGCLRFEVRGKAPVVGPDAEIPLPPGRTVAGATLRTILLGVSRRSLPTTSGACSPAWSSRTC